MGDEYGLARPNGKGDATTIRSEQSDPQDIVSHQDSPPLKHGKSVRSISSDDGGIQLETSITESAHNQQAAAQAESKRAPKEQKVAARSALLNAWWDREDARAQLSGGFSLEAQIALENATKVYNNRRKALMDCMPGGKLNEEDSLTFPELSKNDRSSPKVSKILVTRSPQR